RGRAGLRRPPAVHDRVADPERDARGPGPLPLPRAAAEPDPGRPDGPGRGGVRARRVLPRARVERREGADGGHVRLDDPHGPQDRHPALRARERHVPLGRQPVREGRREAPPGGPVMVLTDDAARRLGRWFFGAAIVLSGLQQLLAGAFVRLVPKLSDAFPMPHAAPRAVGALLVAIGLAILLDRGARAAAG